MTHTTGGKIWRHVGCFTVLNVDALPRPNISNIMLTAGLSISTRPKTNTPDDGLHVWNQGNSVTPDVALRSDVLKTFNAAVSPDLDPVSPDTSMSAVAGSDSYSGRKVDVMSGKGSAFDVERNVTADGKIRADVSGPIAANTNDAAAEDEENKLQTQSTSLPQIASRSAANRDADGEMSDMRTPSPLLKSPGTDSLPRELPPLTY